MDVRLVINDFWLNMLPSSCNYSSLNVLWLLPFQIYYVFNHVCNFCHIITNSSPLYFRTLVPSNILRQTLLCSQWRKYCSRFRYLSQHLELICLSFRLRIRLNVFQIMILQLISGIMYHFKTRKYLHLTVVYNIFDECDLCIWKNDF